MSLPLVSASWMDTTDTCTFNGDCFKILLMIHQGHKAHPCNYEYFWSHLHPPAVFDCIYPSIVTTLVAFIFKREEGGGGGGHRRIFHQMSLIQKRCNQQTGPLQPHIVYTYPWCHPSFTWHENMEGEMVQSLAAKVEAPFLAKCDMILATFTPSSQTLPYSPK